MSNDLDDVYDNDFDSFQNDDTFDKIDNELDEDDLIEDEEEPLIRDKGNWIYNNYSDKELRNETLEFLSNYIKHKSNRITTENEIYNQSLIDNVLNKDIYINLLNTFITSLIQNGLKISYDDLLNKKFGWNHTSFQNIKNVEDKEVAKRLRPITVEEGIYTCKKCGGKHTQSYEIQMRRADEPATVFIECMNPKCRNSWKIN